MKFLWLTLLLGLCHPIEARAHDWNEPEPGDVGVYADASGTESTRYAPGFLPFRLYVVAFDPPGDLQAMEFRLGIPPSFTVFSESLLGNATNMAPPESDDYVATMGSCESGPTLVLVEVEIGYFAGPTAPTDLPICVGPVEGSLVGRPAYADCSGVTHGFGLAQNGHGWYPDGCFVLNPLIRIVTEVESFSAVKSRFR